MTENIRNVWHIVSCATTTISIGPSVLQLWYDMIIYFTKKNPKMCMTEYSNLCIGLYKIRKMSVI